ncbi:MAG: cyclic nucleotide-binding domain-containing protein [Zetaproteobacteria bacterium CG12_big_fil_rev_8_21_14_0_65_54_13]|nr:MAG: cyclic nucleotide-binding protein [Zetaproteobacteria bacterium CG23_combo_of_CG06-09_8_20_14_all_54_7]PIW44375.1 MAG: cyclic nucleotide-binding domain-containing protein [Zetaproteobacteria bacterium CG12_big_fil_rev_8_21_14_0_65_54_13]PIX55102.1 MAG: cyclic nucleotide-binding domain-containing protein [Zetaproteobacteria bacterium CG_4_10_14_3_um_filter_54_28]PJA30180.1 MAG: cyclic nucleotide-binding domain-containing protein [Zetaproteobacteria bacterium CG_4_9_14_3_um_filter_54_145]
MHNDIDDTRLNRIWSRPFRKRPEWVEEATRLCLEHCLFEGIAERSIQHIVSHMHPRDYQRDEVIFEMAHAGASAMLILSGEVLIMADTVELTRLHQGDIFGEVALATALPRTAQAIAAEDCRLVFFLRSDLDEWIERRPREASRFLINLSTMLAERLMERNLEMMEAAGDVL